MRQRTIVCPLIQNDGAYLLCKMADDRGVFPGQWRFRVAAWSLANELKSTTPRNSRRTGENSCFDRNHAVDLQR
ncbi:NUDIX-family hydrolase [Escherichia coli]|uniref:NUDIX-family hydrolase n=1 Tax=Escherichia coli TaxID=562 RepID=A0A376U7D5_ECOLX|nr:NUDIX-family hydrolase [Escherichia coli]